MESVDKATAVQLKQFVEKIERLEEEKAALGQDIRDVFNDAKAQGFDVKVMRQVIKLRKMNTEDRNEQEELLTLYMGAIDMAENPHRSHDMAHEEAA